MKVIVSRSLLLGLCGTMMLATSSAALASTSAQKNACKMAVLEQSKFHDLPMASVSVFDGKDKKHVSYTVRWDGLKANGNCKVNKDGDVKHVKIKKFHDGRTGNSDNGGWKNSDNDDFYYDRHIGKWRDPGGEVCHSCTPDNGFPRGGYSRY